MKKNLWKTLAFLATVLLGTQAALISAHENQSPAQAPSKTPLLKASGLVENPSEMVRTKLLSEIDEAQVRWEANYEKLKTPEDISVYQKERKDFFWKQLGALWEKTPLNVRVTGKITKPDYRAEKIVLETHPNFFATGTLFLPREEKFKAPYPGVLVVCGHAIEGKASEFYQGLCILGAMNGLAMFILDPIDQGERGQYIDEDGQCLKWTVPAHNLVGGCSILLGRNTATFEIWDMVRGLDFLQSHPEVIPDRLGVAGNSGGGTQSSYLMALDDRVLCAAPCCYLCNFFDTLTHFTGPQDAEQNIFGQLRFGMDHADYLIMRAPKPTMLGTKTSDFFNCGDAWKSYRYAHRIFSRYNLTEKLSIAEVEGEHGYCPELLNSSIRWMLRWLAGRDELIEGSFPLPTLTEDEIKSLPHGVMALDGARNTYDLNRDLARELAAKRSETLGKLAVADWSAMVRQAAGIRPLAEIPPVRDVDFAAKPADGSERILESEDGIYLPLRLKNADSAGETLRLIVTAKGRESESVQKIIADLSPADGPIGCVELRGWGESQGIGTDYYDHYYFGEEGTVYYLAYLLGKSYVGMRTEDLLTTARYLRETTGKKIELIADAPSAGIVLLHAAAAEPDLFAKVTLSAEKIPTWTSWVEASPAPIQLTDVIHGVLNLYDLDELENAVNALAVPVIRLP